MATKKQRAIEIYNTRVESSTRADIISQFVADLDMTPAGAATYYAMCKSHSNNPSKPRVGGTVIKKKDEFDDRPLYTCCALNEANEVVSTSSYFSQESAKVNSKSDEIVVIGLPPLDQPISSEFVRI